MNNLLYRLQNLGKTYQGPAEELTILNNINLEIVHGQSVAIVGASGSGKSTLLHIMGTLDQPSTGKIFFENQNLHDLD
ncbi:MAG: ATP-binding cassette domain-containing protein, partial [Desulfoplanes sp.]